MRTPRRTKPRNEPLNYTRCSSPEVVPAELVLALAAVLQLVVIVVPALVVVVVLELVVVDVMVSGQPCCCTFQKSLSPHFPPTLKPGAM